MNGKIKNKIWIILLLGSVFSNTFAQKKYDFDHWPGKKNKPKTNIELSDKIVLKHNMHLTKGSMKSAFLYRFSYTDNNKTKIGKLQISVLSDSEKAQLVLYNYLESLNTIIKPSKLNKDEFEYGDIAFGNVYDGTYRIAYTINNIFIILHAPEKKAKEIALYLDEEISKAPEWKDKDKKPLFNLNFNIEKN